MLSATTVARQPSHWLLQRRWLCEGVMVVGLTRPGLSCQTSCFHSNHQAFLAGSHQHRAAAGLVGFGILLPLAFASCYLLRSNRFAGPNNLMQETIEIYFSPKVGRTPSRCRFSADWPAVLSLSSTSPQHIGISCQRRLPKLCTTFLLCCMLTCKHQGLFVALFAPIPVHICRLDCTACLLCP